MITEEQIKEAKRYFEEDIKKRPGYGQQWGAAVAYTIINENLYWWLDIDYSDDSIKFEGMIPGANNNLKSFKSDLHPGIIISKVKLSYNEDVSDENLVIERSNVDSAGDDFSVLRITVRKLKDE
jgi:hypothetical protein